jgi:hypothetical protein
VAEHTFQCAVGDRSTPLSVRCYDPGRDNNLAGLTVLFAMDELSGTNKLAETSTGVTVQPGQTFTAATTDKLTCNGHGLQNDWEVILSTSSALPAGLSSSLRYFVRDVTPNTFKLSLEPQGAVVDVTDTGTGTQTIKVVGMVQYAWTAADVLTAGTYKGWFVIQDASGFDRTFPTKNEGIGIEIVTAN